MDNADVQSDLVRMFKDKKILITGGTGFLGRALIKSILRFEPHSIRVYSRDEVKHSRLKEWLLTQEGLTHEQYDIKIRNFIGDIRDYVRLNKAMDGVDYVIHAAALKRLDILEYNVEEAIKTNILGTLNVVNACLANNVQKAVFVSTDKACSPANTYGACKFVGERAFIESNYCKGQRPTILTCVRYGNVLESTGSVIPFFESRILSNQSIPLTDTRMTRFIIGPQQAVELIFEAFRHSIGGEVFVPKLKAFRILDLIDILKNKHNAKNEIELVGIRPGEKIHELMINSAEIPRTYSYKGTYIITSAIEKYQDTCQAPYIEQGVKLSEKDMREYSSEDSVIDKQQVKELLIKLGVL